MAIDYSQVPWTSVILDIEVEWSEQVHDMRNPKLALKIMSVPYYEKYIESVRDAVKRSVGKRFVMFGAVSDITFALWREGEALLPMGLTFNRDIAKAAKKGVPLEGKRFIIFQTYIELPWILMRGNTNDEELVIDLTQVSYHTLAVIG